MISFKKSCISLLLSISYHTLFSQGVFRTTFYFTDAIGNQDSIIVGHDTLATDGVDPEFGEMEINTPFDSVFEVRAGIPLPQSAKILSKIVIGKPEKLVGWPDDCYLGGSIFMYVWAKHQPVTVKWKREVFSNNICVKSSLICNHNMDETIYPYDWDEFPENVYKCLAVNDSLIIDVSKESIDDSGVNFPIRIEKEVEGKGLREIYGLRYYHNPLGASSACDSRVPVLEIEPENNDVFLYPNPGSAIIQVKREQKEKIVGVQIFNFQGIHVLEMKSQDVYEIDVSSLDKGLYLSRLTDAKGGEHVEKFVKF